MGFPVLRCRVRADGTNPVMKVVHCLGSPASFLSSGFLNREVVGPIWKLSIAPPLSQNFSCVGNFFATSQGWPVLPKFESHGLHSGRQGVSLLRAMEAKIRDKHSNRAAQLVLWSTCPGGADEVIAKLGQVA